MKKIKYLLVPFLMVPFFVFAQTGTTISDLQVQIDALLSQINDLQVQLTEAQKGDRGVINKELQTARKEFRLHLKRGTRGDEVTQIQEILAQDSEIYPEGLITGYFGSLTEKAVARFQAKYGIDRVGVVGPKTRAKLNSLFVTDFGKTPPGLIKKFQISLATSTATSTPNGGDDEDDGTVTPTDTKGGVGKVTLCHKQDRKNPNTISVGIPATLAHLLHGDAIGACSSITGDGGNGDGNDGDNGDGDDVTAPIISNIIATSTTASTTLIVWDTDEDSDSKVTYSTSTPVSTATTTLSVVDGVFVTGHAVSLIDLIASTTYYYFVESMDASGNQTVATEELFMTQ